MPDLAAFATGWGIRWGGRWSNGSVTGPAAVRELAEPFRMSLPSFLQRLDVLENCGLVKSAEGWLQKQRAMWNRRMDQLDSYLAEVKERKS